MISGKFTKKCLRPSDQQQFCLCNGNGPYNNYTFVSATMTMSHYYSDIGMIEVDAYINTQRAQVDSIQTINSGEIAVK